MNYAKIENELFEHDCAQAEFRMVQEISTQLKNMADVDKMTVAAIELSDIPDQVLKIVVRQKKAFIHFRLALLAFVGFVAGPAIGITAAIIGNVPLLIIGLIGALGSCSMLAGIESVLDGIDTRTERLANTSKEGLALEARQKGLTPHVSLPWKFE